MPIKPPQTSGIRLTTIFKSLGSDNAGVTIQSVIMAAAKLRRARGSRRRAANRQRCGTSNDGRGCLTLTGGVIQKTRGAVGTSAGYGYTKRYSYDRCAVINPPPYFPTTGRYGDNRYYELDPVKFDPAKTFQQLTPGP